VGRRAGAEWYLSNQEDAQALVDSAAARLHDHGVAASGVVMDAPQGRVAEAIWDQADAFGADLVVVGSHGRSAIGGILLGSVAYHAIHLAHAPVLVVR
jgi:nucleotide-binding universal stress UspA family protein